MSGHGETWSSHRLRSTLAFWLVILLGCAFLVAAPLRADAGAGAVRLSSGEKLTAGQRITSPSGNLFVIMQSDGNLVLYAPGSKARWDTNTQGNPGAYAVMQGDGNLVVYSSSGGALWNSQTNGSGATFAQVQDDGNFVLYTSLSNGRAVWQSGTQYYPSRLNAQGTLSAGQRLQSPNGVYEAVMQGDGNFVLYGPAGAMWHTGTSGSGANRAVVQSDGNLVLYNAAGQWKWQSRTDGKGAGFLQVQDDGNLVLYSASSKWIWQTYTYPGYQPPTPPPPPAPAPPPTMAAQVINYATQQIGKPYVWGAAGPNSFDCSGLTLKSWAAAGVSIPRVSSDQYARLPKVPYAQARPGDILAWGSNPSSASSVYHVAIYIGDGKMIEAPGVGGHVRVTTVRTYRLMPYVLRPAG